MVLILTGYEISISALGEKTALPPLVLSPKRLNFHRLGIVVTKVFWSRSHEIWSWSLTITAVIHDRELRKVTAVTEKTKLPIYRIFLDANSRCIVTVH